MDPLDLLELLETLASNSFALKVPVPHELLTQAAQHLPQNLINSPGHGMRMKHSNQHTNQRPDQQRVVQGNWASGQNPSMDGLDPGHCDTRSSSSQPTPRPMNMGVRGGDLAGHGGSWDSSSSTQLDPQSMDMGTRGEGQGGHGGTRDSSRNLSMDSLTPGQTCRAVWSLGVLGLGTANPRPSSKTMSTSNGPSSSTINTDNCPSSTTINTSGSSSRSSTQSTQSEPSVRTQNRQSEPRTVSQNPEPSVRTQNRQSEPSRSSTQSTHSTQSTQSEPSRSSTQSESWSTYLGVMGEGRVGRASIKDTSSSTQGGPWFMGVGVRGEGWGGHAGIKGTTSSPQPDGKLALASNAGVLAASQLAPASNAGVLAASQLAPASNAGVLAASQLAPASNAGVLAASQLLARVAISLPDSVVRSLRAIDVPRCLLGLALLQRTRDSQGQHSWGQAEDPAVQGLIHSLTNQLNRHMLGVQAAEPYRATAGMLSYILQRQLTALPVEESIRVAAVLQLSALPVEESIRVAAALQLTALPVEEPIRVVAVLQEHGALTAPLFRSLLHGAVNARKRALQSVSGHSPQESPMSQESIVLLLELLANWRQAMPSQLWALHLATSSLSQDLVMRQHDCYTSSTQNCTMAGLSKAARVYDSIAKQLGGIPGIQAVNVRDLTLPQPPNRSPSLGAADTAPQPPYRAPIWGAVDNAPQSMARSPQEVPPWGPQSPGSSGLPPAQMRNSSGVKFQSLSDPHGRGIYFQSLFEALEAAMLPRLPSMSLPELVAVAKLLATASQQHALMHPKIPKWNPMTHFRNAIFGHINYLVSNLSDAGMVADDPALLSALADAVGWRLEDAPLDLIATLIAVFADYPADRNFMDNLVDKLLPSVEQLSDRDLCRLCVLGCSPPYGLRAASHLKLLQDKLVYEAQERLLEVIPKDAVEMIDACSNARFYASKLHRNVAVLLRSKAELFSTDDLLRIGLATQRASPTYYYQDKALVMSALSEALQASFPSISDRGLQAAASLFKVMEHRDAELFEREFIRKMQV
eukprot:gene4000-14079_t